MKLVHAFYGEIQGKTFRGNQTHASEDGKPLCGNPHKSFGDSRRVKYWIEIVGDKPSCQCCQHRLKKTSKVGGAA